MSTKNFEQFYTNLLSALRVSLTQVSGDTWIPQPPVDDATKAKIAGLRAKLPLAERNLPIPLNPISPSMQAIRNMLPPHQPSYTGFQLIDITRLGTFALVAFRWREREEIFVHTVDLHTFAIGPYGVEISEVIISMNLLEQLGGQ